MNEREALKLALEALESCSAGDYSTGHVIHPSFDVDAVNKAIDAIDEVLAQPEQEPVAWGCNRYIEDDNGFQIGTDEPELVWGKYAPDDNGWWPLYTTPPQRKPLTDEELAKTLGFREHTTESTRVTLTNLARAIEDAHGIKE